MGIPQSLRQETIPEDAGQPFRFTQNAWNRQGSAGRGRFGRTQVARSAYTGMRRPGSPSGEGDYQTTVGDSFRAQERYGGGGSGTAAGHGTATSAMGGTLSSALEGQVIGDIFGPTFGAGALSGLTGAGYASQFGADPMNAALSGFGRAFAGPMSIAGMIGRGVVATGRAHVSQQAGTAAAQALSSRSDPGTLSKSAAERLAGTQTHAQTGTWDALKGFYDATIGSFGSKANRDAARADYESRVAAQITDDPHYMTLLARQRAAAEGDVGPAVTGGYDPTKGFANLGDPKDRSRGRGGMGGDVGGGDVGGGGGWGGDPSGGFNV